MVPRSCSLDASNWKWEVEDALSIHALLFHFLWASQSFIAWKEEKLRCLKIEGEFCWLSQDYRGKLGKCLSFTGGIFTAVSELKGIQFPLEQLCQCRAEPRRISHSTGYQANKMNWGRSTKSRYFKTFAVLIESVKSLNCKLRLSSKEMKSSHSFIRHATDWYHSVLWRTPLESRNGP